jgi:hypothetical protein
MEIYMRYIYQARSRLSSIQVVRLVGSLSLWLGLHEE